MDGCLVEARVSEPGPGTRTLLLRVPGMRYIGGGFVRQYVNSICPDIIEQIRCPNLSCESFFGKILSYIVWGCTLGLMSDERIMESRSLSSKAVRNNGRPSKVMTSVRVLISGVDVGR